MLHALSALAGRPAFALSVAHLDHGARGARGASDAEFVGDAARRMGLDALVEREEVRRSGRGSWEAAARAARYAFLERAARGAGADRVAVAHTADDQAETVLHRLCRGSGLRGLAAMRPSRPLVVGRPIVLVRPLLGVTREEVMDYLDAGKIPHRFDETNEHMLWTRNRLRRRILPLLSREVHPRASRALARFAAQAAAAADLVASLADGAERSGAVTAEAGRVIVACSAAAAWPLAVRAELWRRVAERLTDRPATAADVDRVEDLLGGRRRRASLHGGRVSVAREADTLTFEAAGGRRRGGATAGRSGTRDLAASARG